MSSFWKNWVRGLSVFLVIFGVATVISGGSVLFTSAGAKAAGAYFPLVVWFNFAAGFAYVLAGAGLILRRPWGKWLSLGILVSTLAVFSIFLFHVAGGGAYEARTVYAMTFRSAVWAVATITAWRIFARPDEKGGG